ncbi:MAG: alpha/beta hydrolase fold domain-containing protein [Pseudomonadota bacterium]
MTLPAQAQSVGPHRKVMAFRPGLADRALRRIARYGKKPILAAIPSQKVLRLLFALAARLGGQITPGSRVDIEADGSRLITPPGLGPDAPVLLYLHGGGFTIGSPATHAGMASHIARAAGLRVYLPRYPLAPEAPFPAAPEACLAVYRRLVAEDTPPVALAGDSAGGNLALVTALAARVEGLPLPRALALLGPVVDQSADIAARVAAAPQEHLIPAAWAARIVTSYAAGHDLTDPRLSPIFADLSALPPTLIQTAEGEVLSEDAERLAAALPQATHQIWPGLHHVWHLTAGRAPAASLACAEVGAFLKGYLSATERPTP